MPGKNYLDLIPIFRPFGLLCNFTPIHHGCQLINGSLMGVWPGVAMDSPKVLLGPAMPYHCTFYDRPPPKRSYGVAACRVGGLRPSSTPLGTLRRRPLVLLQHSRTLVWKSIIYPGKNCYGKYNFSVETISDIDFRGIVITKNTIFQLSQF
jgi:hypothetical protein